MQEQIVSNPFVGSSNIRIFGSPIKAHTKDIFFFIPNEKEDIF